MSAGTLLFLQLAAHAPAAEPSATPECTGWAGAERDQRLRDAALTEVSGLAVLGPRRWVHNDSGDSARIFDAATEGRRAWSVALESVEAVDFEDMTYATIAGQSWLLVGDIGDNREHRPDIRVHRLREPSPGESSAQVESFVMTYPHGPQNAESMFVDPRSGALYILTKNDAGRSAVYRAALGDPSLSPALHRVATVVFPNDRRGSQKATAAAISADGSHIAVRTYTDAWIWTRGEESVEAALGGQPCRLRLDMEPQGEAIAWDGLDLLTVSEGAGSPFLRYRAVEEVGP